MESLKICLLVLFVLSLLFLSLLFVLKDHLKVVGGQLTAQLELLIELEADLLEDFE